MTTNQRTWKQEIARIKKEQRRLEKAGIVFINTPIPKTPKRVTKKAIERLKNIDINALYQQGYTINLQTGELELNTDTYSDFKRRRRSEAQKRSWQKRRDAFTMPETDAQPDEPSLPQNKPTAYGEYTVIIDVTEILDRSPRSVARYLLKLMNDEIAALSVEVVGQRMQAYAHNATEYAFIVVEDSKAGNVYSAAVALAELILGSLPAEVEVTINRLIEWMI